MSSRFFIDRPVFAAVISIVIVLAGALAIRALPIAQYPELVPPQVVVSATYPGASAETLAQTVAAPLEQQINGVEGMLYMQSTNSSSGTMQLTVTFAWAQTRIKPLSMSTIGFSAPPPRSQGRSHGKVSPSAKRSTSILGMVAMFSEDPRYDRTYVGNYALLNVVDELKRIPGVGDASASRVTGLFHAHLAAAGQACRVQPDAERCCGRRSGSRTPSSPLAASAMSRTEQASRLHLFRHNAGSSSGQGGIREHHPAFERKRGRPASQGRGARGTRGPELCGHGSSQRHASRRRSRSTSNPALTRSPRWRRSPPAWTSSRELSRRVSATAIPYNTTKFIEVSIEEVIKTFIEAIVLVVAVVFLFLQNWRATLIPVIAVPISIIGTFAGMYLLGFSINLLTLFGLVLAIGIVVDDAIVVLENVERIMCDGAPVAAPSSHQGHGGSHRPCHRHRAGALRGVRAGDVHGRTGRRDVQAVRRDHRHLRDDLGHRGPDAHAGSVRAHPEARTSGAGAAVPLLQPLLRQTDSRLYGRCPLLGRRVVVGLLISAGVVGMTAYLFMAIPGSSVPDEDQGFLIGIAVLPPAASLSRTRAVVEAASQNFQGHPAVENVFAVSGFDLLSSGQRTNGGTSFVSLKDWAEREAPELDARKLARLFIGMNAGIQDGMVLAFSPPPIQGLSTTGGFELYVQDRTGGGVASLNAATTKLMRPPQSGRNSPACARRSVPMCRSTGSISTGTRPRRSNVPINSVFEAMQSTFGSLYVNDFTLYGRNYRVMLQSEANFRQTPDDLRHVFVKTAAGSMIPLSTLVTFERVTGPDQLERFNAFNAAKVTGNPAPGYTSGQAIAAMQEVAREGLPEGFQVAWTGSAYQELETDGTGSQAMIFGLVMVFLILAAQYEKWSLPLAVITAVPFALFGALVAIWLRGLTNDVYFQIGLVTLIGLAAKNAILIVEFAVLRRQEGASAVEAAIDAARLRFRPIVMTSLAFILGVVPLAISTGAGSASRHSIGTGVIGGMLAATFIATFLIPMFYRLIAWRQPKARDEDVVTQALTRETAMI